MSEPIEVISLPDIVRQILRAQAVARQADSLDQMPALLVLNYHGRATLRQDREWALHVAYRQTAKPAAEGGEVIADVTVVDDPRAKAPATLYLFSEAKQALAGVEARSDTMHGRTLQLIEERVRPNLF